MAMRMSDELLVSDELLNRSLSEELVMSNELLMSDGD
jgi:hypothetical protein